MKHSELLSSLQNLTNYKPTQAEIVKILGVGQSTIGNRAARDSQYSLDEIILIEQAYGIAGMLTGSLMPVNDNCVSLNFYPEVYLSAGYGIEVIDEKPEKISIDARLLVSDRGTKLNHEKCEVVRISGNSMSPEYRHGDRVIIDKGDTELADGHIFAFRYKGQCYVKEINLLGNKIKCISINKEYDAFYIDESEDFLVFGRIIPRIRL
jgi:phage repressor protein C with HTH and peptisase S24 domain